MEKLVRALKIITIIFFALSLFVFILLEISIAQHLNGTNLPMLFKINNTVTPITIFIALANILIGFIGIFINWQNLEKKKPLKTFVLVYGFFVLIVFLVTFAIANTHLG